jgi:hypothetical protein
MQDHVDLGMISMWRWGGTHKRVSPCPHLRIYMIVTVLQGLKWMLDSVWIGTARKHRSENRTEHVMLFEKDEKYCLENHQQSIRKSFFWHLYKDMCARIVIVHLSAHS